MKQKNLRRLRARLIAGTWRPKFHSSSISEHQDQKHNAKSAFATQEPKKIDPPASTSSPTNNHLPLHPDDLRWKLESKKKQVLPDRSRQQQIDSLNRRLDYTKREIDTNRVLWAQCRTSFEKERFVYKKKEERSATPEAKVDEKEKPTAKEAQPTRLKSFVLDQTSGVVLFSK